MVQKSCLDKILLIAGPTASGKTAFSLKCAKEFNGEIIGCDSMQIYRELDIGTGKLKKEEQRGINHTMIDIIPPNAEFSVFEYVKMTEEIIDDMASRGKLPIIVGGTGLYMRGLINGLDYAGANKSDTVREKYKAILEKHDKDYLYEILKRIDPKAAQSIHANDTKRVIRALEIFETTGQTKSEAGTTSENPKYRYKMIVLSPQRERLYANINKRVDKMVEDGLVDEVKALYKYKDCQSMQAIGYKEIVEYLDEKISLPEAIEAIKINSRHYAKRQLTYFKNVDLEKTFYNDYNAAMDSDILADIAEFIKG